MSRAVGIDLGTTYSAVAVIDDTGSAAIVPNSAGRATTPSVVLFETAGGKDAPIVGDVAKAAAGMRPGDIVQHVKRFMGDSSWRFDSANDVAYGPEEVSAIILQTLVKEAETALGEPVTDVVITVPAYFDDSRRTATKQAGALAGLTVLRILNEPTAAALSYGLSTDEDGIILVCDLGGGTFDVTILGIEGKSFTVLATDGDRNLGGTDWDNAIMNLVVAELESVHGVTGLHDDLAAIAELREKSENAKRALSDAETASIHLACGGRQYEVSLTREQFETATGSLLRRAQEIIEDALDDAGVDWDDLTAVVPVGGSTRMPAVRGLLARLAGVEPVTGVNPDEAVALGAAVQAALESTDPGASDAFAAVVVQDVTSHALGTPALDEENNEKNWVVIAKNTPVPATGHQVLTTLGARTELHVAVTQGDDPDLEFVTQIGYGVIRLDEEWPPGTDYVVLFRYDFEQTVGVEVYRLPDETYVGAFDIDRIANLGPAGLEAAAERLDALVDTPAPGRAERRQHESAPTPTIAPLRPASRTQTSSPEPI